MLQHNEVHAPHPSSTSSPPAANAPIQCHPSQVLCKNKYRHVVTTKQPQTFVSRVFGSGDVMAVQSQ